MLVPLIAVSTLLVGVEGILHIDHVRLENNNNYNKATESHSHDYKGNAVVGIDITTFVTVSKMLLYIKANVAKDENDDLCSRELINTVMDVNKLIDGAFGNILIKAFMESFIDQVQALNITMPLKPVSLH